MVHELFKKLLSLRKQLLRILRFGPKLSFWKDEGKHVAFKVFFFFWNEKTHSQHLKFVFFWKMISLYLRFFHSHSLTYFTVHSRAFISTSLPGFEFWPDCFAIVSLVQKKKFFFCSVNHRCCNVLAFCIVKSLVWMHINNAKKQKSHLKKG